MLKSIVAKTCIICARNSVLAIGGITTLCALITFGTHPFESFIRANPGRWSMFADGTLVTAALWATCVGAFFGTVGLSASSPRDYDQNPLLRTAFEQRSCGLILETEHGTELYQ